jgi:hypothetical protein
MLPESAKCIYPPIEGNDHGRVHTMARVRANTNVGDLQRSRISILAGRRTELP